MLIPVGPGVAVSPESAPFPEMKLPMIMFPLMSSAGKPKAGPTCVWRATPGRPLPVSSFRMITLPETRPWPLPSEKRPTHLLGRHVRGRPEDGALAREPRGLLVGLDRRVELGETEVEDLGDLFAIFAFAEVNVLGLEIPVNDADGVGLGEAFGDLGDDPDGRVGVDEPHPRHAVVERFALDRKSTRLNS